MKSSKLALLLFGTAPVSVSIGALAINAVQTSGESLRLVIQSPFSV